MVLTLCIFFTGFAVGEFYLREVLSHNSGKVASLSGDFRNFWIFFSKVV